MRAKPTWAKVGVGRQGVSDAVAAQGHSFGGEWRREVAANPSGGPLLVRPRGGGASCGTRGGRVVGPSLIGERPVVATRHGPTVSLNDTACSPSAGEDGRYHPKQLGWERAVSRAIRIRNAARIQESTTLQRSFDVLL